MPDPTHFSTWLRQQRHRDDPVGDLATEVDYGIRAHLLSHTYRAPSGIRRTLDRFDAPTGAYAALDRAAAEWEAAR